MSSRFILSVVSFSLVCTIPQYNCTALCFVILQLLDIWLFLVWGYFEWHCYKYSYLCLLMNIYNHFSWICTSGTAGSLESCVSNFSGYCKVSKVFKPIDTPLHPTSPPPARLGVDRRKEQSSRLSPALPSGQPSSHSPGRTFPGPNSLVGHLQGWAGLGEGARNSCSFTILPKLVYLLVLVSPVFPENGQYHSPLKTKSQT